MTATRAKAVAIGTGDDKPHLSKAQKAFNLLIRQIETERARLGAWEAAIPSYQHKYSSEMLPLKDLLAFEELRQLKAWLKDMRRQPRIDDFDDCPF